MNTFGRVSVCGSISTYNVEDPPKGNESLTSEYNKCSTIQRVLFFCQDKIIIFASFASVGDTNFLLVLIIT